MHARLPAHVCFVFFLCLVTHQCEEIEPLFRPFFHACGIFLLKIDQHGLYDFIYSDDRDDVLLSVIVERGIEVRTTSHYPYFQREPLLFFFLLSQQRLTMLAIMKTERSRSRN